MNIDMLAIQISTFTCTVHHKNRHLVTNNYSSSCGSCWLHHLYVQREIILFI